MCDCPTPAPSNRPAASEPPVGPEAFGALDDRLTTALALARRRASRDGHGQLDTAHLLHSLLESDREVWDFVGDDGPYRVGRLLGYLVQRSIGYGMRWQGTVEDSGSGPQIADTGEVADLTGGSGSRGRQPRWSPVATAAMERALHRARARRSPRVSCVDLFAALVADGECRAVEVLRRTGVDTDALAARLA